MRFDWYQATIQEKPLVLVDTLKAYYGAGHTVTEGRGLHGYRQRFDIRKPDGDVTASILAGGANGDPNAWASGDDTDRFVEVVRQVWPGMHYVTRLDAAQDFDKEGAYALLRRACRAVAKDKAISFREIRPGDPSEGRTFYVGSPSSPVMSRLYEKGKQLHQKMPAKWRKVELPSLDNVVRLELRVRPKGDSRVHASCITPEEAWGFADWSAEVARKTMELDVPRVQVQPWRQSDDERAFRFMLKQYGPLLIRMRDMQGSWPIIGEQIGITLDEMNK